MTLLGLGLGLLLFVHSTVPALEQRRELREVERRYADAFEQLQGSAERMRRMREALPHDPELILIEFDELGMLPDQAVRAVHGDPVETGR